MPRLRSRRNLRKPHRMPDLRRAIAEGRKVAMEPTIRPMLYAEAKECIAKINANMTNIRSLVLELYERKGWDALGYESWRECVVKEFQQSQSYLYYQLEAAQTERNISTMVEKSEPIPESQLRPLARLEPEKQGEPALRSRPSAPPVKDATCAGS